MSGLAWPLQKAIFAALQAAMPTATFYDEVPQKTAYPYITVGADDSKEWDTKPSSGDTGFGEDVDVTLHQWSRYQGRKEVKDMQAQIYAALHNVDLALETGKLTLIQWVNSTSFMDEDGVTHHGVMRFRALATNGG